MDNLADSFCRDCLHLNEQQAPQCASCQSPRLINHEEWRQLAIAHIDCDAFYAAVEKRDNPELIDEPVIIGGGKRGVVSTACYIARINGVRSAMPMYEALKLCPDAVVIKPNMEKYSAVGREVRNMMESLTPMVEPISIDEAFLDLNGTERLAGKPPAMQLAQLAIKIHKQIGISVSIGLSYNKFLAKIASDLEKPQGFSILGQTEALDFLARKPVNFIWGVGKALQKQLHRDGITTIGHLQHMDLKPLIARYGSMGTRLYYFSRAKDNRIIDTTSKTKSISAETTFEKDIYDHSELDSLLWQLAEKVSYRAKQKKMAGETITLKLKTKAFQSLSRSITLPAPTQLADRIFAAASPMLSREATGKTAYRLLGVGLSHLSTVESDEPGFDLDHTAANRAKAELAMDKLRAKFGPQAVKKGRGFKS